MLQQNQLRSHEQTEVRCLFLSCRLNSRSRPTLWPDLHSMMLMFLIPSQQKKEKETDTPLLEQRLVIFHPGAMLLASVFYCCLSTFRGYKRNEQPCLSEHLTKHGSFSMSRTSCWRPLFYSQNKKSPSCIWNKILLSFKYQDLWWCSTSYFFLPSACFAVGRCPPPFFL